jgi:hypothetical protein
MRLWVVATILAIAALVPRGPAHAQYESLTAACSGDSIVIAYVGRTPTPAYPILGLWRQTVGPCNGWRGLWFGVVGPDQVLVLGITDKQVSPDSLYRYQLAPLPGLGTPPDVFRVYDAYAGCGSPGLARGVLRSRDSEMGRLLNVERCAGSCWPGYDVWSSQVDLTPYVDQEVELRGTIWWYWQWYWVMTVTAVAPRACDILAVEPRSWSDVKSLYR